ncbi:MAG: DEAD/DEAH box helicase [Nanoarchaeota archaeon]|nr:DEAD/DEAH box helicase [Nanoarchaeota archaeon]
MNKFEEFGLSSQLLTAIGRLGFEVPTEIQEKIIPHIIQGKDVIGESSTGSGKTLAFGCGIIEKTIPDKGLQALILTPTRELAEQVKKNIIEFSYRKNLSIIAIYGGVGLGQQTTDLRKADIVIATPGRLLDHYRRKTINLSAIKILVLDEADRMLDMGFIVDIEKIINACPKKRQTLLFSATIPPRLKLLSKKYLIQPLDIRTTQYVDPSKLKQVYYNINKNAKISLMLHLFEENSGLAMVFCNSRKMVDFVTRNLRANKINAIAIHGGLKQNKRTQIIKSFNDGKAKVLACTDVAARGLHIEDVSHIYNYDIPKDPKDYVHRIGRTARAGESGKVVNLLCEYDFDNFSRLINEYRNFSIDKMETPKVERAFVTREVSSGNPRINGRNRFGRGSSSVGRTNGRDGFRKSFGKRTSFKSRNNYNNGRNKRW